MNSESDYSLLCGHLRGPKRLLLNIRSGDPPEGHDDDDEDPSLYRPSRGGFVRKKRIKTGRVEYGEGLEGGERQDARRGGGSPIFLFKRNPG